MISAGSRYKWVGLPGQFGELAPEAEEIIIDSMSASCIVNARLVHMVPDGGSVLGPMFREEYTYLSIRVSDLVAAVDAQWLVPLPEG